MLPKHIIHLLSGGLDSVTLLYDLQQQGHFIHCLLFDYGQAHKRELEFAKWHCHKLNVLFTVMSLPSLGGLTSESWIVPNRNAVLLSLAVNVAVKAKASTVTIGCNAEDADYFPDCRRIFLDAMNAAVKAADHAVEICAPYLDWPKWKIGGLARELAVPTDHLWSCYKGADQPCGECPACLKLTAALLSQASLPKEADPYYGVGGTHHWK
jgi:7-cyano-7-deazaguanine synthase